MYVDFANRFLLDSMVEIMLKSMGEIKLKPMGEICFFFEKCVDFANHF